MAASIGEKAIRWVGSSYADLMAFPRDLRQDAGFQLGKVQAGLDPTDWKPFNEDACTREIRLRSMAGSFRVMYVVRFDEAVYVLHCLQKKTQATSSHDKSISAAHYRAVEQARRNPSWPWIRRFVT